MSHKAAKRARRQVSAFRETLVQRGLKLTAPGLTAVFKRMSKTLTKKEGAA